MKNLKSIIALLFAISAGINASAQSSGNYSLITDRNGSLENMTGADIIISPNNDEASYTPVFTQLPFRFLFMGEFWDRFKVSANGIIWFGNDTDFFPAGANNIGSIPNSRRISGLANLHGLKTHSTDGKVVVKTFGTAPNRYAVIQWTNMGANAGSTTKDITYQVKLNESEYNSASSGEFEFIYDKVSWGQASTNEEATCGFQTTNQSDKRLLINIKTDAYSPTNDLRNSISSGTLTNLDSEGQATKKRYLINSNAVTSSASTISVNCLSSNSVQLVWDDNSPDNLGYAIYLSTDGSNYSILKNEGANAEESVITGLIPNTTYWARIHAFNEGKLDPTGSVVSFTTREFGNITAISSGNWDDQSTWSSNTVPTATDDVTIGCIGNYTVTVNTDAYCRNLAVEGGSSLVFNDVFSLTASASVTNNGTVDYSADNTAINIAGDLINNGKWDAGLNSETNFNGSADQNIINSAIPNLLSKFETTGKVAIKNRSWSEMEINVPAGTYLKLSSVKLEIKHNRNADLDIYLQNPAGERIQLANNNGGDGKNYSNVVLSDDATNNLPWWKTEISGEFRPFESLSNLSNLSGGKWVLQVNDQRNKNTGNILEVALNFETAGTEEKMMFHHVQADNSGGEIRVSTNIEMTGHLSLDNGVINMFAISPNSMYLYADATADNSTNSSYVFGKIIKLGKNDFTFPVGDGGYAANAELIFAGGNPHDEF